MFPFLNVHHRYRIIEAVEWGKVCGIATRAFHGCVHTVLYLLRGCDLITDPRYVHPRISRWPTPGDALAQVTKVKLAQKQKEGIAEARSGRRTPVTTLQKAPEPQCKRRSLSHLGFRVP